MYPISIRVVVMLFMGIAKCKISNTQFYFAHLRSDALQLFHFTA